MIIIYDGYPVGTPKNDCIILLNGPVEKLTDIAAMILLAPLRPSESIYAESINDTDWYCVRISRWPYCLVID